MKRQKILFRLARKSIRSHLEFYRPFRILLVVFNLVNLIFFSLLNDGNLMTNSFSSTKSLIVTALFTNVFFITTVIAFLGIKILRERKKEYATWLLLGITRKELAILVFYELLINFTLSFIISTITGIILYGIVAKIFTKFILTSDFQISYFPKVQAVLKNGLCTSFIFLITLFFSTLNVLKDGDKALKDTQKRKDELKKGKLRIVLSFVTILLGYIISLSTDNPIKALYKFSLASALVIVGNLMFFEAALPAFLRFLQKREKNRKFLRLPILANLRFNSIRSARSLSDITILSCAFFVVTISSLALFFNLDNVVNSRMETEYIFSADSQKLDNLNETVRKIRDFEGKNKKYLRDISFYKEKNIPVSPDPSHQEIMKTKTFTKNFSNIELLALRFDLNNSKKSFTASSNKELLGKEISFDEINLPVVKKTTSMPTNEGPIKNYTYSYIPKKLYDKVDSDDVKLNFLFNLNDKRDEKQILKEWDKILKNPKYTLTVKSEAKKGFYELFFTLFFVGVLLSLGYLISLSCHIYLTRIIEFQAIKNQFEKLIKIGVSDSEIEYIVKKQSLIIMWIPFVIAVIHMAACSKVLFEFLKLLGFYSIKIYMTAVVIIFVLYLIYYLIVCRLSIKSSQKIVKRAQ